MGKHCFFHNSYICIHEQENIYTCIQATDTFPAKIYIYIYIARVISKYVNISQDCIYPTERNQYPNQYTCYYVYGVKA